MQDYIPRKIDINETIAAVTVKQFDNKSRFLHIEITDRDLPDSEGASFNIVECEARLYVERPEGNPEYIDGKIADGENGIVTFTLPNSVTQEEGTYSCEIWLTNPADGAVISTKPFLLRVEKSIRNDAALEASESFSALENALLRVAIDRARLNHLTALTSGQGVAPGTVDSEVLDIRTGYDGTTYTTAGSAVRQQIKDIHDSVATTAEFISMMNIDYDENEEAQKLVSDLKEVLKQAHSLQSQIDNLSREIENIAEFIPNGSLASDKLSTALRRPDITVSAGTVAEMLRCAESYFNQAYTNDGRDSGILYESHTGLYSESLGANEANKQYGIVCSSFVDAVLNGIFFENSRYSGKSSNIQQSWGAVFDGTGVFGTTYDGQSAADKQILTANKYLTSQNIARYAAEHGYLYAIDGHQNVRAGDVVFTGNEDGRYLGIDHVAIVVNNDGEYCTVIESWPSQKTDIDGTTHDVGLRIQYRRLSYFTYGATFPLGDVQNTPSALESVYNISGNTNDATLLYEFTTGAEKGFHTIVCHGSFDDLPYVSVKYAGAEVNTTQSGMHRIGSDCYLTIYVQKPGIISVRMAKGNAYKANEITLYRGYAEITAQNLSSAALGAGDDLNDCLDGIWYCRNTETAGTILHAPLGANAEAGFRLEAVRMTNGARYMQTVWYVGRPDKMYVRMYLSTGWTGWVVYSGEAM